MLIRRPLILLLGGLLTAGSVGCSAFQTVVGDRHHRGSRKTPSAERMVAVARVFENQGKYDQAAAMYQSALRFRPNDPVIRQQLQQVMARRSASPMIQNNPAGSAGALALGNSIPVRSGSQGADGQQSAMTQQAAVRPSESGVPSQSSASVAGTPVGSQEIQLTSENVAPSSDGGASAVSPAVMTSSGAFAGSERQDPTQKPAVQNPLMAVRPDAGKPAREQHPQNTQSVMTTSSSVIAAVSAATGADHLVRRSSAVVPVDGATSRTESPHVTEITLAEVLEASNSPDTHVGLLLQAIELGDCAETQTLAAALLAECDLNDFRIRDALTAAQVSAADPGLLIAIADTQLHRGEATRDTAKSLRALASGQEPEYQVQAVTSLRHFAGTASDQETAKTLESLLTHHDEMVRSTAAVTLGDFITDGSATDEQTLALLTRVASEDNSESVRHAARFALQRRGEGPHEFAVPIHASGLRQVQH